MKTKETLKKEAMLAQWADLSRYVEMSADQVSVVLVDKFGIAIRTFSPSTDYNCLHLVQKVITERDLSFTYEEALLEITKEHRNIPLFPRLHFASIDHQFEACLQVMANHFEK